MELVFWIPKIGGLQIWIPKPKMDFGFEFQTQSGIGILNSKNGGNSDLNSKPQNGTDILNPQIGGIQIWIPKIGGV